MRNQTLLETGRNARPRLSHEGHYIYGAIARTEPTGAENWAARAVDFHIADLRTSAATRFPLATGVVSKFQLSRRYAFFANISAMGDWGILLDVEPASATFQQVVARIALPRLVHTPVSGQPTSGKEARASAITPDGRWAFTSQGGEGTISVIDTEARAMIGTIKTPTPLSAGGYLIAVQRGALPSDTCMR